MKTEIKKIEYADGNCKYIAKWKRTFTEFLKYDKIFHAQNVGTIIIAVILLIIFFPLTIAHIFDYNQQEFDSLEKAKEHLDIEIGYLKELEQGRMKNKLSRKVVKTSKIKHP